MLFAVIINDDKRCAITAVVVILLLALLVCGHVTVSKGEMALVKPAFGLVAVHTVGGAVHDDVIWLNGLG